jgi:hypothetical protein
LAFFPGERYFLPWGELGEKRVEISFCPEEINKNGKVVGQLLDVFI